MFYTIATKHSAASPIAPEQLIVTKEYVTTEDEALMNEYCALLAFAGMPYRFEKRVERFGPVLYTENVRPSAAA